MILRIHFLQAVTNVDDLTAMNEYLEELGFKHYRFGAKAPHFDVRHPFLKFSNKKFKDHLLLDDGVYSGLYIFLNQSIFSIKFTKSVRTDLV